MLGPSLAVWAMSPGVSPTGSFRHVFQGIVSCTTGQCVKICMWAQRLPGEADSGLEAEAVEEARSE